MEYFFLENFITFKISPYHFFARSNRKWDIVENVWKNLKDRLNEVEIFKLLYLQNSLFYEKKCSDWFCREFP